MYPPLSWCQWCLPESTVTALLYGDAETQADSGEYHEYSLGLCPHIPACSCNRGQFVSLPQSPTLALSPRVLSPYGPPCLAMPAPLYPMVGPSLEDGWWESRERLVYQHWGFPWGRTTPGNHRRTRCHGHSESPRWYIPVYRKARYWVISFALLTARPERPWNTTAVDAELVLRATLWHRIWDWHQPVVWHSPYPGHYGRYKTVAITGRRRPVPTAAAAGEIGHSSQ